MFKLLNPTMPCKLCKKVLGGGFKVFNGGFHCAECLVATSNIESAIGCYKNIISEVWHAKGEKISGRRYKEAFKNLTVAMNKITAVADHGYRRLLREAQAALNKPVIADTKKISSITAEIHEG